MQIAQPRGGLFIPFTHMSMSANQFYLIASPGIMEMSTSCGPPSAIARLWPEESDSQFHGGTSCFLGGNFRD